MEITTQEKHEKKVVGSYKSNNTKVAHPNGGNISDTTIEDSNMNGVGTAKQSTEEGQIYKNTSTKSSEQSGEHAINMNQPVITINRRGWTSRVVPNQFDICIVQPTMNDEEIEKQKNEQYQVPAPEHVNQFEDFQDKVFKGDIIDAPVDSDDENGQATPNEWDTTSNGKDYFIKKAGYKFAGNHLLIDLWGATNLDNAEVIEAALRESAIVSGATILHCHLHNFEPNGGISGVLVLSESHISIHSWPERGYASLDVFMCGEAQPLKSIPILKRAFKPGFVNVVECRRGLETDH